MDCILSEHVKSTLADSLEAIACAFVEYKDNVKSQCENEEKLSSIRHLAIQKVIDKEGMVLGTVGNDDFNKRIVQKAAFNVDFKTNVFIIKIVDEIFKKFNPSLEDLFICFSESPIFTDKNKYILQQGLQLYIDKNYLAFVHLMIPQIESVLLNLLKKMNQVVIKQRRNDGYDSLILGDILSHTTIKDVLGENIAFTLRSTLTDTLGLNIRNLICHGKDMEISDYTTYATIVFCIFILLGGIRYKIG